MVIYMDESLDRGGRYLCLGALFVPDDGPTVGQIEDIKAKYRRFTPGHSFSDIKYSRSGDDFTRAVCQEMIDLFIRQPAWFRVLVADTTQPGFSWRHFGEAGTSRKLAKTLAYNWLAELLLKSALPGIANAVLLADDINATAGDDFIQRIYRSFGAASGPAGAAPPPIRYAERVDTSLPRYQLGQMCDVLLGVVTGDLAPPDQPQQTGPDSIRQRRPRRTRIRPGSLGRTPQYPTRHPGSKAPRLALAGKIKSPGSQSSLTHAFSGPLGLERRLQLHIYHNLAVSSSVMNGMLGKGPDFRVWRWCPQ